MTHNNLKTLGLTLFAAIAISATGATGAWAAQPHAFKSEADSTVLTASDHTEEHNLSLSGENLKCQVTNFSGTQTGQEATELTITATYDECEYGSTPAEFRTNHCGYVLTATTTAHAEQKHARIGIDCENAGEHLEVELPSIGHCVFTIIPASGQTEVVSTKGVTYTNAEGEVTVDITAEFTFERHEGAFLCNLLDEEGTATWTGNLLLKGYEDEGTPSTANEALTFTADETATTEARGITHWDWSLKEGDRVDVEVGKPVTHTFKSEASSTVLTTDSDVEHELTVFGSVVKCKVTNFSGTQTGQEATELTITPTYDECQFDEIFAEVRTNHCGYIFTGATSTQDEESHARVAIECEGEGEHIEIELPSLGHCNFTVEPQEAAKGVTYKNVEDEEGNKDVTVDITAEVAVARDTGAFLCNILPTHGIGVYEGASTLTGYEDEGTPTTANETLTWTGDETATTENRGTTHWDWSLKEGDRVDIEVGKPVTHAFKSEADSTILTASDHTEAHKLSLDIDNLECNVTNFSGTQTGQEATELMITATYDECEWEGMTAEFRTNHCGYVLTAATTVHAEQEHARVGIDCESTDEHLEVEIPSLGHCVFTIIPASGQTEVVSTKGVTYTNAEGEVTVDITAEFTFERHEGAFLCNLLEEEGTATWTGNLLLEGYEDKGTPSTANEALTFTADETATTEARGTTHWDWSELEGSQVDIEVDGA